MEDYKQKLLEYLETNDLKHKDSGNKVQHVCISPNHSEENPSAFTSFENEGEYYVHCSSCGFHLNMTQLVEFLGGKVDKKLLFKNKMDKMFKEFKAKRELQESKPKNDWKNSIFLPPKYKDFKQNYRGISPKTFSKVSCFITDSNHYYKKRLIFPLYNYKKELQGFDAVSTSKDIVPKVLRSKNCKTDNFFGFEDLLNQEDFKEANTLFINEGLFSALAFIELGYKAVYNFGVASIEDKLEVLYKSNIKQIVLVGDKDSAGFEFNGKSYHLLKKSFKVKFFKHPWSASEKSDSNDYLKEDKQKLQELIDKTLKII